MRNLPRKSYAAIYVEKQEQIEDVEAVIHSMDSFEYDYLPDCLIKPFSEYPGVAYTHKFCDLDMDDLTAICWSRGIRIWVFYAGEEFPQNANKKYYGKI